MYVCTCSSLKIWRRSLRFLRFLCRKMYVEKSLSRSEWSADQKHLWSHRSSSRWLHLWQTMNICTEKMTGEVRFRFGLHVHLYGVYWRTPAGLTDAGVEVAIPVRKRAQDQKHHFVQVYKQNGKLYIWLISPCGLVKLLMTKYNHNGVNVYTDTAFQLPGWTWNAVKKSRHPWLFVSTFSWRPYLFTASLRSREKIKLNQNRTESTWGQTSVWDDLLKLSEYSQEHIFLFLFWWDRHIQWWQIQDSLDRNYETKGPTLSSSVQDTGDEIKEIKDWNKCCSIYEAHQNDAKPNACHNHS